MTDTTTTLYQNLLTGASLHLPDVMDHFGAALPLLHELEHTEQDPEWHGEGNVRIHTEMVLAALQESLDTWALSAEERAALLVATAFHDIAKPLTTRRELIGGRERMVSPRHADRGRSYLGKRLPALGITGARLHAILGLVGHHHDPLRLSRRNADAGAYLRLARHASPRLLYALEQADLRGRICADLDKQLQALDFYYLRCEEEDVAEAPPRHTTWAEALNDAFGDESAEMKAVAHAQAVRDVENDVIHSVEEAIARSYRYTKPFPTLYVMCGVAGSGKSTWADTHLPNAVRISLDEIRQRLFGDRRNHKHEGQVVQAAKQDLKQALAANRVVVWDATNLMRERRSALIELGFAYGALVRLMAFNPSQTTLLARNDQRTHALPPHIVERQFERFEIPYAQEAHEVYLHSEGEAMPTRLGITPSG